MATHQAQVIALILGEQFGESAQIVASTLLSKGRLPLSQLITQTGLPPKQVREALFVLIQHNIVSYTEAPEGLRVVVHYSVNALQVLLRDRFPEYIRIAKLRFGEKAQHIIAEILKHGKCTFLHLQQALYPMESTPPDILDEFEDAFNTLIEQNFVVRVGDDDSVNVLDRKVSEEAAEVAKNPNMSASEKTKMKKALEAKSKGVEFEDMPTGMKRKLVYSFEEGDAKAAKVYDEDENMAERAYWRINPSRFHIHCRNEVLTALAESRINTSAKHLLNAILTYGEPSMKHCKADEVSAPITLTHLGSDTTFDKSLLTYNPSTPRASLQDYLALLTLDQDFPFLTKQDERGGGQYVCNLLSLKTALHQHLITTYLQEKFGIVASRIWRLLHTKGKLDEKQVAKLALISNKVAREKLYEMLNVGLIQLQDVPKTVDHAPSRTFFLWYVSLPKCVDAMILETYHMLSNLKIRRLKEYNANGALIEKIERSDIQEDESLLTDGERKGVEKFHKVMNMIRISEIRLDRALLILRDF
ncbi:hypothetical protein BCR33DRAFT_847056 [Rhizoclosmatium globosum]|uniref:DNA-directed RNA polymerase III subunit RPC3 n=1 Tax=Rhizoclosmatium globosum TaxID=329046 RepID=A0A1Y2CS88_9FUNG|nr:hypothetical protein BCR33DRAFT_847056 [Rhizoclosmatium globosum]|eukprot:ORY49766.1 hypothetical protein BCR33DRAFT_847056 [Rhizoclosmatium globosum]